MLTERQINTFKRAVDAQFGVVGVGILESATVAPAEPATPEPIAPTAPESPAAPDVEPAIDVEVEVADATVTDFPDRTNSARVTRYRYRNATQQNVTG